METRYNIICLIPNQKTKHGPQFPYAAESDWIITREQFEQIKNNPHQYYEFPAREKYREDKAKEFKMSQKVGKLNNKSKKPFIYDPSKRTQLCALRLCNVNFENTRDHFPVCSGFDVMKVDGANMFRY